MTILVIEDNPLDVDLLREALREVNSRATIVVASDGEEGLRALFSHGDEKPYRVPDLILLDLTLPNISGFEVLRRIKTNPDTRHIPIIVLSSARADADVERAYESHANAYIQKPATLDGLLTAARGLKNFWMDTARLANHMSGI